MPLRPYIECRSQTRLFYNGHNRNLHVLTGLGPNCTFRRLAWISARLLLYANTDRSPCVKVNQTQFQATRATMQQTFQTPEIFQLNNAQHAPLLSLGRRCLGLYFDNPGILWCNSTATILTPYWPAIAGLFNAVIFFLTSTNEPQMQVT